MKLKTMQSMKLAGRTVLMRVDFNVDLKNNKVVDDFRIQRTMPAIKYLLNQDCRIILASHLGRPNGKRAAKYSLAPVARHLRARLKPAAISFIKDKVDDNLAAKIKKNKSRIVVLENLRYDQREEANDSHFAKQLAAAADVYVNEAFAVSHRRAASIVAITKFLPSGAGLNLAAEVKYLSAALKPRRPAVALIGGVKVSDKFGVIKNFLKKYDKILVGGGVANLFLHARKNKIGASVYDSKYINQAKRLKSRKIILPVDFVIADKKTKSRIRYHQIKWGGEIARANEMILDIGPETIKKFAQIIRNAKTIVWGGPMGFIDLKAFSHGSDALAKIMAARAGRQAAVIAGGGETITVINRNQATKYIDCISTGGGAMLEFLEGKSLPGIKVLQI